MARQQQVGPWAQRLAPVVSASPEPAGLVGRWRGPRSPGGAAALLCAVAVAVSLSPADAWAAPPGRGSDTRELEGAAATLREVEQIVVDAERAAAKKPDATAEELARRLVQGQLMLAERDVERAAVVFLDLLENHRGSPAAAQAQHYLGRALALMEMRDWAADCFARNLADVSPDGARHHQASIAGLLRLAAPPRDPGFARRPGLSALPEARARLAAVGLEPGSEPPPGVLDPVDEARVLQWARGVPEAERSPQLRAALARYLYLRGEHEAARAEVDGMFPPGESLDGRDASSAFLAPALYVAGASSLALGEVDDALDRFARVTSIVPATTEDREILDLAWMARGRILHDLDRPGAAARMYRRIARDSPYFPEAMYETAWTLLRAEDYPQAIQALDLLLIYDPDSPIVAEIKQLRGKVRIQARDYQGAEEDFLELRREFDALGRRLGRRLGGRASSSEYFAAVVAEDMRHFGVDAVLPVEVVSIARALPRVAQTESIANEVGRLEDELRDTRALLVRMEQAVRAPERARLFQDLNARLSAVDGAGVELVDLEEALIQRLRVKNNTPRAQLLETRRKQLRAAVDGPQGGLSRSRVVDRITTLAELAHRAKLTVAALRAQLVGAERYYEQTRADQKIDPTAHLQEAAALRDEIGALEREVARIEDEIEALSTSLRFADPWSEAQRTALREYDAYLDAMYAELASKAGDAPSDAIYRGVGELQARSVAARRGLDRAAGLRLTRAIQILSEERANLDRYLVELTGLVEETRVTAGEVIAASFHDVMAEVTNLVTRSEVGLLDVAWAVQSVEADDIQRLETERARDLRELDRILEQTLEEFD